VRGRCGARRPAGARQLCCCTRAGCRGAVRAVLCQRSEQGRRVQGRGGAGRPAAPARPAAVHEHAAAALVNLTGECERCREAVRACGGVAALERMRACADSATARRGRRRRCATWRTSSKQGKEGQAEAGTLYGRVGAAAVAAAVATAVVPHSLVVLRTPGWPFVGASICCHAVRKHHTVACTSQRHASPGRAVWMGAPSA